jgi:hypothetical protein
MLLLSLLLALPAKAEFSASSRGGTAADFLQLGVGARAVGMGEAYSAVADDATALYWNPAAMTQIAGRSLTLMHASYLDSSYFDYGGYARNNGRSAVGAGLQYFSAGSIIETDTSGTETGRFTPYDLALSLGYARKFGGYGVGVSGKFIQSRIIKTARTGALDVGVLTPGYFGGRLKAALTATNIGGTMKFDQVKEKLPLALRAGAAYRPYERWLLSFDAVMPRDDNPYAAAGTEYKLVQTEKVSYTRDAREEPGWSFAGRAGFNSQTLGSIDGFSGVSLGMGVDSGRYAMDYAFVPFGGVGQAHRLSLHYHFGED